MTRTALLTRLVATAGAVVAAVLGAIVPAGGTGRAIEPDPFGEYTPVVVVLDTSGSMGETIPGSAATDRIVDGTRLDAAQSAVLDLIGGLGSDQPFGMVAYPGRSARVVDGCSIGRREVALGPLDVAYASASVRRLTADGNTPTGPALQHAADVLKEAGYTSGVIVLFSDGESNCGSVPVCEIARSIRSSGLDVVVNTVGLSLESAAEQEMRCIADATGGRYAPVTDLEDLSDAMVEAGRSRLTAEAAVPRELPVVISASSTGPVATVTASVTGRVAAKDVRISLVVSDNSGRPGAILVPRPVRYLGNIASGQEATAAVEIRPDDATPLGPVSWTVTVSAANAPPHVLTGTSVVVDTLSLDSLGPLLRGAERVVVLGDSYSSGEGIGDYLPATEGDACHRSMLNYGGALWGENATTIACSGAVTSDFFTRQDSGKALITPQLDALRELALSEQTPDVVLLSIGGNDAGFGEVGARCIIWGNCLPDVYVTGPYAGYNVKDATIQRALDITNDVARVLRAVDTAVNDQTALAARDGRIAPIVLLPYPRIIPDVAPGADVPDGCMFGLSSGEVRFLNRFFDTVNTSVSLAAYELRGDGRPVYVATDVEDAFLPDHTICEGPAQSYAVYEALGETMGTLEVGKLRNDPELLHPNALGHAAMARALVTWSNSAAARTVTDRPAPDYPRTLTVREPPALLEPLVVRGPEVRQGDAGSPLVVRENGFAPGSQVLIRLDSTPRVLGSATSDVDGRIATSVQILADVPMGAHHLHLLGVAPDGSPRAVTENVTVLPRGGLWNYALIVGGALLAWTASSALFMGREGRRGSLARRQFGLRSNPDS